MVYDPPIDGDRVDGINVHHAGRFRPEMGHGLAQPGELWYETGVAIWELGTTPEADTRVKP